MDGGSVGMAAATLCSIVKNERRYLLEWIAYHRLVGFDRLVIYSNDCTDGSEELLDGLDAAGIVQHRRWPSVEGQSPQRTAYNDAVRRCETEWIGFLDADEFLALRQDPDISSFLARFPAEVSAIAMNWRIFGSSRHVTRRRGLVIKRFTLAAPRPHHLNRHCKTIARAAAIDEMHIHSCTLRRGLYVDPNGQSITIERMGFTPEVNHERVQVNHYVVKSLQEFREKQRRGNANRPPGAVDKYTGRNGNYFEHHDHNEEPDEILVPCARLVLAEIGWLQATMEAIQIRPEVARRRHAGGNVLHFRSRRRPVAMHLVAGARETVEKTVMVGAGQASGTMGRPIIDASASFPDQHGDRSSGWSAAIATSNPGLRSGYRQPQEEEVLPEPDNAAALAALACSHLSLRLLTALLTNFPAPERDRVRQWLANYGKELTAAGGQIPEALAREFPISLSPADASTLIESEIAALRLLQKAISF